MAFARLKSSLALLVFTFAPLTFAPEAQALETPFVNLRQIAERAGFTAYAQQKSKATVKIAILDNGFRGYKDELGKSIPESTTFHAGPVPVAADSEEAHGLAMAQIVSGLLNYTPQIQYELHLFSAFGYSNLEKAVTSVIEGEFDIVLYSQVWEYGGNGDGLGFINALVSKATQAGVIWINAAGNFGDSTFRSAIKKGEDDWAKLPGPNQSVQVRCQKNSKNKCQLRAVLSWNDFKNDVKAGTDKDLDFVLTDDALKIIRTGSLVQKKSFPDGEPGSSLYPREIIQTEVTPGLYYLRVKVRSENFSEEDDELRITTSGDFIELVDRSEAVDTLLSPADNAMAVTVGASDSEKSSSLKSGRKPELLFPSALELKNKETYKGSSNSAAVAAAAAVVLKGMKVNLTRDSLLQLLSTSGSAGSSWPTAPGSKGQGLTLEDLRFEPTGVGCFLPVELGRVPRSVAWILSKGGIAVKTSMGVKIFTQKDPASMIHNMYRLNFDDMIIATPVGFDIYPRSSQPYLQRGLIEIVQIPLGQRICGGASGSGSTIGSYPQSQKSFALPPRQYLK